MKRMITISMATLLIVMANSCTHITYQEASLLGTGVLGGEFITVADTEKGEGIERPHGVFVGLKVDKHFGRYMDKLDDIQIYNCLETYSANKSLSWLNPNTGGRYTVVAGTAMYKEHNPIPCRAYSMVGNVESIPVRIHGVACRDSKGNWNNYIPEKVDYPKSYGFG